MSQQWYYAVNGNRQGPVSGEQLKQLAASGEVRPTDLLWKEGMSEWAKASSVKGLFADLPKAPPAPPPLPQAESVAPPSPQPSALATAPVASSPVLEKWRLFASRLRAVLFTPATMRSGEPQQAPALWNPFAARLWSLPFTPAFGAFLHARNWMDLGEEHRAKRSMIWFYSFIGFLVVAVFAPNTPGVTFLLRLIGFGGLIVWCCLDAEQQIRYVKERFGSDYPRKDWMRPLGIGAAGLILTLVLMFSPVMSGTGSITFAEQVDTATMEIVNESSTFSTGWVQMVVRGRRPFGCTRLVFYHRPHGGKGWSVLRENTISPEWDVCTVPILLAEPGDYDIRAATQDGNTIAEGLVHVVAK